MKINNGMPEFDKDLPDNVKQSVMHITTGEQRASQYMWAHVCEAAVKMGLSMHQMAGVLDTCRAMLMEPMVAALKSELPNPEEAIRMFWPHGKPPQKDDDADEPESYFN